MSAQASANGRPLAVRGDPPTVLWENGKVEHLSTLRRPALMKVAGAVAPGQGGLRAGNDELLDVITARLPWGHDDGPVPPGPVPEPAPSPERPGSGFGPGVPTAIQCDCGHEYTYRIKAEKDGDVFRARVKWLQGKPCPACARGNTPPKQQREMPEPQPEPEATPEPTPEQRPAPKPEMPEFDLDRLRDEIAVQVLEKLRPPVPVVGELHHELLPDVLALVRADIPVWLQGTPGWTKSTLTQQVAANLDIPWYPLQCQDGMAPSALFGYRDANGQEHRTPLWDGWQEGGLVCLDECDNGNGNLTAALNGPIANGHGTFGGRVIERHEGFRIAATANTAGNGPEAGYLGRYGVDRATKDRFVTVLVGDDTLWEDALAHSLAGNRERTAELVAEIATRRDERLAEMSRAVTCAPNADEITAAVRKLRAAVVEKGIQVIVSPRTTIFSVKMTRIGFTLAECFKMTALASLDTLTSDSLLGDVL